VQGVGFRASAAHEARRLGLDGWVRNLLEGSVELEASGTPAAVDAFVAWLGHGPPGARVTGVDVHEVAATDELQRGGGFEIR